jgi:hypothetical protein
LKIRSFAQSTAGACPHNLIYVLLALNEVRAEKHALRKVRSLARELIEINQTN